MTKIDILSGFLGAGKTTLIKKLIDQAFSGEKLVLIENEFGEIGIDGGFLKEAGVEITEMNSGCICCSLVGDFGEALKKVIDEFAPDRVIIEPSGVGKLSDVMKAVEDVKEHADVAINSATTVVDVQKCKMYMKNFGEFFNNQVESAGTIVLSRTQNVDEKKISDTVALLREHNKDCAIITTPWDDIDGKVILDAMEHANTLEALIEQAKKLHEEHEHYHHDHDEDEHHHHDHDEDEHHHHDHDEEEHHHHDHDEDEHHHHDHDEDEHHHEHGEGCTCGCHHHDHDHHHHHADDIFSSWGLETAKKYDKDEMKEILEVLAYESDKYGVILRAKGIVASTGSNWIYFDLVPGEYEIRDGKPDYTGKLCVIGSELKEDLLKELFKLA
ncbi:MAG: GTP-binding protein [Lachnospiraceae bacterium]|nr:GTP-binding protein [Lachnospiraceae bacterium]